MKKIIFIDVDGTLVDYSGNLPDSAVEAIRKTRKKGNMVYLCTGRSKAEIYQKIWDIGFDGLIGGNGAYIEYESKMIYHQVISKEECTKIIDWLLAKDLPFYLESNNGLFASKDFDIRADKAIKAYSAYKGKDPSKVTVRKAFPHMIYDGEVYRDDVNKISFVLNTYDDYLQAKKTFNDLEVNTWGGKEQKALFGDIGVKGMTKEKALLKVLEYHHLTRKDAIAIGDATIDIGMLKECAIGIAMNSGSDDVKKIADYVCKDVDDDGLYDALEHYNLI